MRAPSMPMLRPNLALRAFVAGAVLLRAASARADDQACPPLAIEAAGSVEARWPELVPSTRAALERRENIDRCARIRLSSAKNTIGVEVALADGRVAVRSVAAPEDVEPTLEALLLLPAQDARSTRARPDAATNDTDDAAPHVTPARTVKPPPSRDARLTVNGLPSAAKVDVVSRGHAENDVRVELSAATGARVGDGQLSLGFGLLSFLELSGWLVGFEGRLDRYQLVGVTRPVSSTGAQTPPPDGVSSALELGVLVGRRVPLGSLAFDVVLGPAAALQGTTTVETQSGGIPSRQSSSSTVPRLLLLSRMTWGSRSVLRGFVGIDGEVGSTRAGTDVPGAPRLPRWTLGLALGATVGTL